MLKSRNFGFVVPDDKKFATDIFISKKQNQKKTEWIKLLKKQAIN